MLGRITAATVAAAAIAESMRATAEVLPVPRLDVPEPPSIRLLDPRTRRKMREKARRREENERNRRANLRVRKPSEHAEFNAVVNRLSGWQRNQWARAGYPGLKDKEPREVAPFAELVHA